MARVSQRLRTGIGARPTQASQRETGRRREGSVVENMERKAWSAMI